MVFYVICGKPECKNFAHATYVAQFLCEHLPNFKYKKIEKSKADWPDFVLKLNKKNIWYMVNSPIIWKEISIWGGKPYLIGGLGEFWEYCYCYYGLESSISKENLAKLAHDNVKFFEDEVKHSLNDYKDFFVISLFGVGQMDYTRNLIEELLTIPYFIGAKGCFIKLYRKGIDIPELENDKMMLEMLIEDLNERALFGSRPVLQMVSEEYEAIEHSDLLIFMEDSSRYEDEEYDAWLQRSSRRMMTLADIINIDGKRSLRIIFASEGPICFMATCLIEYSTILLPTNIVALAADRGLSIISTISEMAKIPISKISAPPVWGFIGINEFVDESNTICKAHVIKPFRRALTAPEVSTIPLGTVVPELRLMSYLVPCKHDEITKKVLERKKHFNAKMQRQPVLAKIRALKSLLELWYLEKPSDHIISLGVCSDGSYGIPHGLVFAQPCIQEQRRRWRPFPNIPLINTTTLAKVEELINESLPIFEKLDVDLNIMTNSMDCMMTGQISE